MNFIQKIFFFFEMKQIGPWIEFESAWSERERISYVPLLMNVGDRLCVFLLLLKQHDLQAKKSAE